MHDHLSKLRSSLITYLMLPYSLFHLKGNFAAIQAICVIYVGSVFKWTMFTLRPFCLHPDLHYVCPLGAKTTDLSSAISCTPEMHRVSTTTASLFHTKSPNTGGWRWGWNVVKFSFKLQLIWKKMERIYRTYQENPRHSSVLGTLFAHHMSDMLEGSGWLPDLSTGILCKFLPVSRHALVWCHKRIDPGTQHDTLW